MGRKLKVLIVEDEALTAMSMRFELERTGHEVCAAVATGERAEAAFDATPPDLVLMDINLAGEIDGIETAARLRKRSAVPLIFISGYDDSRMVERAQAFAPLRYFTKPVSLEALVRAIDELLAPPPDPARADEITPT